VGGGVGGEDYLLFRHNGTIENGHMASKPHFNAKQEYGSIYGCLVRVYIHGTFLKPPKHSQSLFRAL